MSLDKCKVLITGINGFTGKHVGQLLINHGADVWGTGSQAESWIENYVSLNILDAKAIDKLVEQVEPSVVIHLAAISFVANSNISDIYNINILGSRNLLDSLCRVNPDNLSTVILASSANIYGNQFVPEGLTEIHPANPVNDYAVSKIAMEHMAHTWGDILPIIVARPFNYTGVGQTSNFLIPKIVSHFSRFLKTIELGNIDVSRDYSDVRFVANVYKKLIEKNPIGETINICSGKSYTLREIIDIAKKITGHDIDIKINQKFVRKNEVKTLFGNPQKMRKIIGEIEAPNMEDTIKWMLEAE